KVDDEEAHAAAFGAHENQGLLAASFTPATRTRRRGPRGFAGFADDALPALAEFFFDHAIELVAVDLSAEVVKLRHVQVAYALVRGLARDEADEAKKGNARGMRVVAALNGADDAVKATLAAAGEDDDWNQQSEKADGNPEKPLHWSPPFL